jgi:two-component system sensor histidine kinase BarA
MPIFLKSLMKNTQIKVALLCLGPALILSLIFNFLLVHIRLDDAKKTIELQGESLSLNIAPPVHLALAHQDFEAVATILKTETLKNPLIEEWAVLDSHGNVISKSLQADPQMNALEHDMEDLFKKAKHSPKIQIIRGKDSFYFITHIADADSEGPHQHLGFMILTISESQESLLELKAIGVDLMLNFMALIFCALMAFKLGESLSKPLSLMIRSAKKIQLGDYQTALNFKDISNFSEFDLLEITWNQMLQSLRESYQLLEEKVKAATRDLEISNQELDQARIKALESEKTKAEFLANMSHEIRTPLNAILGFTDLLLDETLTPTQKEHLTIIKNAAQALLNILNDILDFSKIEAGKLSVKLESFSLRALLEELMALFGLQAQQKNIAMWLQIYPDVPEYIHSDPLRLKQVLINLLGNAIKFTPQGFVLIRASVEENSLKIEIKDTGIGLSVENQKKLFKAFSQADTSTTRQYGGTGLGLIISKKLIELLKGDIALTSKEHQGSVFWITLPLTNPTLISSSPLADKPIKSGSTRPKVLFFEPTSTGRLSLLQDLEALETTPISSDSPEEFLNQLQSLTPQPEILMIPESLIAQRHTPTPPVFIEKIFEHLLHTPSRVIVFGASATHILNHQFSEDLKNLSGGTLSLPYTQKQLKNLLFNLSSRPTPAEGKNSNPNPIQVLVVDDHEHNRLLLLNMLKKFNIQAHGVSSGAAAIEWVLSHPTDLIFMDIQMPEMDGFTTTQKIRALPQGQQIKIFALSADLSQAEQQKIQESGLNGYYLKPLSMEALGELISSNAENIQEPILNNTLHTDELLTLQLQQLPETARALQTALDLHDDEKLLHITHKLHGGLCYVDLPALRAATQSLEQALKASRERDPLKIASLVEKLFEEIKKLKLPE